MSIEAVLINGHSNHLHIEKGIHFTCKYKIYTVCYFNRLFFFNKDIHIQRMYIFRGNRPKKLKNDIKPVFNT